MIRIFSGILLTGVFACTGCFNGSSKKPGTVRPVRPDEPRKKDQVPASISRLMPDDVTEDNVQKQLLAFENEIERDMRAIKRAERRSASAE